MPDDLYDRDILAWSQREADLLRRLARGERVNDVDWAHVVEEIEDVGLSELHAVESFLELIILHLLKVRTWPACDAINHWRAEIVAFEDRAARRFAPAMRQRLDLARLYRSALRQIAALNGGTPIVNPPAAYPLTLETLLHEDHSALGQALGSEGIEA
jgi:hypothetical protein